jgi:hypothetical protein
LSDPDAAAGQFSQRFSIGRNRRSERRTADAWGNTRGRREITDGAWNERRCQRAELADALAITLDKLAGREPPPKRKKGGAK